MGGSSKPVTQTTTQTLSPDQEQILNLAMPGVQQFAATVPQRYQGEQVQGFDPTQVQAQSQALTAAGQQGQTAAAATGAENTLLSGAHPTLPTYTAPTAPTATPYTATKDPFGDNFWDPANNPMLRGSIDAAVRPITEQLTQSTLPGIRGDAVTSGNFGSSRQGIAEGLASQAASRATGDTAAKIAEDEYGTNVNALTAQHATDTSANTAKYQADLANALGLYNTQSQTGANVFGTQTNAGLTSSGQNIDALKSSLGLLPTVQAGQLAPAQTTGAVGDSQQLLQQQRINEAIANFNYDQLAPFLQSKELASLVSGLPGGSATTVASGPQTNLAMAGLGGAATGAALGSAILPGVGTGVGAIGGGLLGLLSSKT